MSAGGGIEKKSPQGCTRSSAGGDTGAAARSVALFGVEELIDCSQRIGCFIAVREAGSGRWVQGFAVLREVATAALLSAQRVDGAPLNVLLAANAVWAHHASLRSQGGFAQQRRDNERCLALVCCLSTASIAQTKLQIKTSSSS